MRTDNRQGATHVVQRAADQMIDELVSMIKVTRTYEANVKLVNVSKDTTNSVIGVAMG